MDAPGKTWLKVCGILFIIFGSLILLSALFGLLFYFLFSNPTGVILEIYEDTQEMADAFGLEVTADMYLTGAIWAFIQSAIELPMGIAGVKYSKQLEKANICIAFAIVFISFELVRAMFNAFAGNFNAFGTLFALALPILYLIGAMKNKQAVQN